MSRKRDTIRGGAAFASEGAGRGGNETRGQRTRAGLLMAARAVADEGGWPAVTVRRVAERAGCSPALVYEYFTSKEALFLELVRDGFRLLLARVHAAREESARGDGATDAALREMVRAYWAFAREHTALYQGMYGLGGIDFPAAETWAEGAAVGEAFVPVVEALSAPAQGGRAGMGDAPRAVRTGGEARSKVETRVYTLWATVHGLVALVLAGRIDGGWAAGEALIDTAVHDALASWRPAP